MKNCDERAEVITNGVQKQALQTQKRSLFNHVTGNHTDFAGTEPTKKIMKLDTLEAVAGDKQSTPVKRPPKQDPAVAALSDFSDWDESPIKQAPSIKQVSPSNPGGKHSTGKENSEQDDSFDDPVTLNSPKKHTIEISSGNVSPRKRSAVLRIDESEQINTSSAEEHVSDSGVEGFPSLNNPKSEVLLTVREVKNEDGLVDLVCVTKDGQESIVYLQDQWSEVIVEPSTRIRLIGAKPWGNTDWLVSNEHGTMIVAPDTLVPCTSIAGATWCPRKVILNDRFRGPTEANKAMLIGIIVHELFQAALRCPTPRMVSREWLLHIWQKTIRDEIIAQLVALRFTPSHFETELEPYLEVIVDWMQHHMPQGKSYKGLAENSLTKVHDIEENIWLPQLGLKGKIDATLEVKCGASTRKQSLELKTGKSGQSSEHAAQVMLYSLMLSSRYNQPIGEGSLLYLKDGITRHVQPRALEMKGIINQRNHLASYLSKLRPDLLPVPKDDPKFCDKCDHALVCSFYQVSVEQASKSSQQMLNFAKSKTGHLSADHITYFKKWITWIYSEWSEDKARKGTSLEDLWQKPVEQRQSEGLCLPNLRLVNHVKVSTEASSSYLLTFEGNVTIVESVFAPGNMCTISTSAQPGILLAPIVDSSPKFVTIRSDRLISRQDTYYLDLYHSFSTYPTTLGNLILLMANTEKSARQRELIIDLAPPSIPCSDGSTLPASVQHLLSDIATSDGLSAEQRNAVQAAMLCNDYTLIEGFPGSGKTTTIVALLRCLLQMNRTVLLTTNTHSALDNVLVKLKKSTSNSKILRLGNSPSVRVDVADLSLESKLSCCDGDKYKAAREILKETPLVASTCHYVPRDVLFSWRTFDYCIIDEASMVLEPVVISAIVAASRFVLVGDAHQLSPLVQSRKCSDEGMSVSLFERLQVHKEAMHSLECQYRMNSSIAKLSSSLFYENRLRCANDNVANACLSNSADFMPLPSRDESWRIIESGELDDAVVFVNTRAKTMKDFAASSSDNRLIQNFGEARLVRDIVLRFIENSIRAEDIGVMCVYRKQVDVIKSVLGDDIKIEVNSVDQFQGRDKRVIVWSLVWTEDSGRKCDLLRDRRRVNVALTRAKHKLIVVGCAESMRTIDIMSRVIDSVKVVKL
ncbi:hypothetical protein V3C99_015650 [Haemonchus contortus]